MNGSMNVGRRLRSLVSQYFRREEERARYSPAASCCSEVVGRPFSSDKDFSAAVRRSVFLRFASETSIVSSLASTIALIVSSWNIDGHPRSTGSYVCA